MIISLFVDPISADQTEILRQLAHNLGINLIYFDMLEYMESSTALRLMGAPPGYIGYDYSRIIDRVYN